MSSFLGTAVIAAVLLFVVIRIIISLRKKKGGCASCPSRSSCAVCGTCPSCGGHAVNTEKVSGSVCGECCKNEK